MSAPGGQFVPDLIGSPHNHPATNPDPDSGGVGGAANHGVVHEVVQRSKEATVRPPWEFTATWADVREKARRIAAEGGVHIAVASGDGIGGTVRGEHDLYETILTYVPGSRKVGSWNCGCRWAAYSWGRSGAFRRFEGRMCAHALALQFEALKQHAFDRGAVEAHDFRPAWMRERTVTVQHQRATERADAVDHRRAASLLPDLQQLAGGLQVEADFDPHAEGHDLDLQHPPAYGLAVAGLLLNLPVDGLTRQLIGLGYDQGSASRLMREALADTYLLRQQPHTAGMIDEVKRDLLMIGDPHPGGHGHDQPGTPGHNTPPEKQNPNEPSTKDNPLAPENHPHNTDDSREHAPDGDAGVPHDDPDGGSEPTSGCHQCGGQGCGACGGAGAVDLDGLTRIPDQNVDAGPYSRGQGAGGGGVPTFASRQSDRIEFADRVMATYDALARGDFEEANRLSTTAEYTSYDWMGDPTHRSRPQHVHSENPGSTGWATSADPGNWDHGSMTSMSLDPVNGAKKEDTYDPPTHAGVALQAADTGRVLMLQRSLADESDPARGRWEFPGGGLEPSDPHSLGGGVREWEEEVGQRFPGGEVTHAWRSGPYRGHIVRIPEESAVDPRAKRTVKNPDDDNETVAWRHPEHMRNHRELRDEVRSGTPWGEFMRGGMPKAAGLLDRLVDRPPKVPPQEPIGGIPSPWESHHSTELSDHVRAQGCVHCGDPIAAFDSSHGVGYCRKHIDAIQSSDRPIAEDPPSQFGRPMSEQLGQRLKPVAIMHTQPEPALPTTEADDEDPVLMGQSPPERARSQMHGEIGTDQTSSFPSGSTTASLGGSVADIVARFQSSVGASALNTPNPAQRQAASEGGAPVGGDIAAAATAHLAKTSMKEFSHAEQRALIGEGEGGPRARNFGELQIQGTHYMEIEDEELGL